MISTSNTVKVIIADDHSLVRAGLKKIIESDKQIVVVGECDNGEEAVNMAHKIKPDVMLLDLRMPGTGGMQATIDIRRLSPSTKIIIVTMCDDEIFTKRMLSAGAHGYLTKDASPSEMIHAIRTVMRDELYFNSSMARKIAYFHVSAGDESPLSKLSGREWQVTVMISNGKKVQDIAEELYLSPKTVNSYRYRIFEKLGISNDVELAKLAIKHGLIENTAD